MRNDIILESIKKNRSIKPDDRILERVIANLDNNETLSDRVESPRRRFVLKPAVMFCILFLLVASSLAVTAAVNQDIREYLVSLFGGNPNSVTGEIINASAESDGVLLNVDAVVAEGDSLFMIFTLKDREGKVIAGDSSLNGFSFSINGDTNFSASYNTLIKEKNYISLQFNSIRKGIQKVDFSIKSLRVADPAKTFSLPVGTAEYTPDGIPGTKVNSIKFVDNRVVAEFNVNETEMYILGNSIELKNKTDGKTYRQAGEEFFTNQDGSKTVRWYSEELTDADAKDLTLIVPFDRVFSFNKPLEVTFDVDFSKKPEKVLHPGDVSVLSASVDKVTVYQMSIVADVTDHQSHKVQEQPPVQVSQDQPLFETGSSDSIFSQAMKVLYEDGQTADAISGGTTSASDGRYRFLLILRGTLDYSRKPTLYIGDAAIPLY